MLATAAADPADCPLHTTLPPAPTASATGATDSDSESEPQSEGKQARGASCSRGAARRASAASARVCFPGGARPLAAAPRSPGGARAWGARAWGARLPRWLGGTVTACRTEARHDGTTRVAVARLGELVGGQSALPWQYQAHVLPAVNGCQASQWPLAMYNDSPAGFACLASLRLLHLALPCRDPAIRALRLTRMFSTG